MGLLPDKNIYVTITRDNKVIEIQGNQTNLENLDLSIMKSTPVDEYFNGFENEHKNRTKGWHSTLIVTGSESYIAVQETDYLPTLDKYDIKSQKWSDETTMITFLKTSSFPKVILMTSDVPGHLYGFFQENNQLGWSAFEYVGFKLQQKFTYTVCITSQNTTSGEFAYKINLNKVECDPKQDFQYITDWKFTAFWTKDNVYLAPKDGSLLIVIPNDVFKQMDGIRDYAEGKGKVILQCHCGITRNRKMTLPCPDKPTLPNTSSPQTTTTSNSSGPRTESEIDVPNVILIIAGAIIGVGFVLFLLFLLCRCCCPGRKEPHKSHRSAGFLRQDSRDSDNNQPPKTNRLGQMLQQDSISQIYRRAAEGKPTKISISDDKPPNRPSSLAQKILSKNKAPKEISSRCFTEICQKNSVFD